MLLELPAMDFSSHFQICELGCMPRIYAELCPLRLGCLVPKEWLGMFTRQQLAALPCLKI